MRNKITAFLEQAVDYYPITTGVSFLLFLFILAALISGLLDRMGI